MKEEERIKMAEFVFDETDYLNVLVNSAGIIKSGNIENTEITDLKEMMEINLYAPFHLIKIFLPLLKKAKGCIVNISSVTGKRAFPNVLSYCISKAAIDHMTRCLALELAPYGIRVNSVNPGVVITNLHKRGGMDEESYQKFLENSKKTHPLGRVGKPEEVAFLVYFLSSEKAEWITGETISIDGGRSQTALR
jgi:NAD(P)-dependent dehydrogenase (short-subunit alcohol dehydrogenase family)